eukprot:scaffold462001_cov48-Prasinocladus_malaysianus.AAC.4
MQILTSAALFAGAHFLPREFPALFLLGAVLGQNDPWGDNALQLLRTHITNMTMFLSCWRE